MDYYERIQNAIHFIEDNLTQKLRIVDISSKACFSAFHFQRVFQAISGFSVQEYIRKRRLTEAASLIKQTDRTILDIAITFQYGSQEAFTRAFESYLDMTPAKFRRVQTDNTYGMTKMNFTDFESNFSGDLRIDQPCIILKSKTNIAGYEYLTTLDSDSYFRDIPKFYDDFGRKEYYMRISDRIAPAFPYGINCRFKEDGKFSFVVGEAVEKPNEFSDTGFVNLEIPEGRYAEFKIKGSVETSQHTWRYIYGKWLPNSGYERRDAPDFEIVDVCKSSYPDKMIINIYIPIK